MPKRWTPNSDPVKPRESVGAARRRIYVSVRAITSRWISFVPS
jgi:hypothetical protein